MKAFRLGFGLGLLTCFFAFLVVVLQGELEPSRVFTIFLIAPISAFALGGFFYYIEIRYIPKKQQKLIQQVIKLFNATPLSETVCQFPLGPFDCYAKVHAEVSIKYLLSPAPIQFHVPKSQVDQHEQIPFKNNFPLTGDTCHGIATYRFYETNNLGLGFTKKRFQSKIIGIH